MNPISILPFPLPFQHKGYDRLETIASLAGSALRSVWRGVQHLNELRAKAKMQRDLHALSDHMLRDIGLHRSQIDRLG
jgi:uncharacterized protein YjiS (DUF1127 family)